MGSADTDIKGEYIFNSNASLRTICSKIIEKLDKEKFTPDDIFALQLAIEEACVNAVNHGNQNDPSKNVVLEYRVSQDAVDIVVQDQGSGFCPLSVPDPTADENLCKTSGRGLLLMQAYMDFVEYNDKGNRVHMVKYASKS